MIILSLIPIVIASFNTNYSTDSLTLQYSTLNESKTYLIQLIVTQFPDNNFCLPYLQIESDRNFTDQVAYSVRSNIQKVYINKTNNITIRVTCEVLEDFKNIEINKTMHFNITIHEAMIQAQPSCQFPKYGTNCNLQMQQIQTDFEITIDILKSQWYYAYTILDNQNYKLIIDNEDQMFGLSTIPADKINSSILPSFTQGFQVLSPDKKVKNFNLIRETDIKDYIFIIGIFNFNMDEIKSITITFMSDVEDESFPLWAILTLILVITLGVVLSILILCYYKKQYKKLTQSKPALDRKILKKYMPTYKIDAKLIQEVCSVCLVQFELKEKYCQTPCRHYFHEQCLYDWTIKQANCPVCRHGLNEEDFIKLPNDKSPKILHSQDVTNLKEDQVQSQTDRDRGLPFLQLGSTPCIRTQCRIEMDNSPHSGNSPKTNFENSPQNQTKANFCLEMDGIVESQN